MDARLDRYASDSRYIREVMSEWARRQPEPLPLTTYQRDILREMLERQDKKGNA